MSQIAREVVIKRIWRYFIWGLWNSIFKLLPYSPLRIFWMKLGGARIGKNSFIDQMTLMNLDRTGLQGLEIGNKVYIGPTAILDLAGTITLEDHVTISARAVILSHHSISEIFIVHAYSHGGFIRTFSGTSTETPAPTFSHFSEPSYPSRLMLAPSAG